MFVPQPAHSPKIKEEPHSPRIRVERGTNQSLEDLIGELDAAGKAQHPGPSFKIEEELEDDFLLQLDLGNIAALRISPRPQPPARHQLAPPVRKPQINQPIPPPVKYTSKFRGVHFHRKSGKWRAQIQLQGKRVSIGSYATDVLAAQAYDKKAREAQGSRAKLNFPSSSKEGKSAAVTMSSNYRGVCLTKRDHKWLAQIQIAGQKRYLGTFNTEIEAAQAYDSAAHEHHGSKARLNFPGTVLGTAPIPALVQPPAPVNVGIMTSPAPTADSFRHMGYTSEQSRSVAQVFSKGKRDRADELRGTNLQQRQSDLGMRSSSSSLRNSGLSLAQKGQGIFVQLLANEVDSDRHVSPTAHVDKKRVSDLGLAPSLNAEALAVGIEDDDVDLFFLDDVPIPED